MAYREKFRLDVGYFQPLQHPYIVPLDGGADLDSVGPIDLDAVRLAGALAIMWVNRDAERRRVRDALEDAEDDIADAVEAVLDPLFCNYASSAEDCSLAICEGWSDAHWESRPCLGPNEQNVVRPVRFSTAVCVEGDDECEEERRVAMTESVVVTDARYAPEPIDPADGRVEMDLRLDYTLTSDQVAQSLEHVQGALVALDESPIGYGGDDAIAIAVDADVVNRYLYAYWAAGGFSDGELSALELFNNDIVAIDAVRAAQRRGDVCADSVPNPIPAGRSGGDPVPFGSRKRAMACMVFDVSISAPPVVSIISPSRVRIEVPELVFNGHFRDDCVACDALAAELGRNDLGRLTLGLVIEAPIDFALPGEPDDDGWLTGSLNVVGLLDDSANDRIRTVCLDDPEGELDGFVVSEAYVGSLDWPGVFEFLEAIDIPPQGIFNRTLFCSLFQVADLTTAMARVLSGPLADVAVPEVEYCVPFGDDGETAVWSTLLLGTGAGELYEPGGAGITGDVLNRRVAVSATPSIQQAIEFRESDTADLVNACGVARERDDD